MAVVHTPRRMAGPQRPTPRTASGARTLVHGLVPLDVPVRYSAFSGLPGRTAPVPDWRRWTQYRRFEAGGEPDSFTSDWTRLVPGTGGSSRFPRGRRPGWDRGRQTIDRPEMEAPE